MKCEILWKQFNGAVVSEMKNCTLYFISYLIVPHDCFVGFYCDGLGLVAETGPCTAGYYCPEGQTTGAPTAYVCPTGSYCPTGSALPNICPRGKHDKLLID